ncbi:helix-turn-helix transcriptional regulator [Verticiella sediminum]|uniref:Helix-turn-helix transcriptional regulator n=1 Tax=Verticiella sediminum TaxID=1247510 RepID=A0A556B105_9BURK|nr:helix-turn-helix transcriptional regulator [Verticiella sediminum]TSH98850.1 helix-turn-helix transcriptional regulator [Verticiella sediminum]
MSSPIDPAVLDRVQALWDELADFDAAAVDAARDHLLAGLCRLVDGCNAAWVGAVRMGDPQPGDPVSGWRPRSIRFLRPTRPLDSAALEQARQLEAGTVDLTTVRQVEQAGRYRTNRLADLVPAAWFEGAYYRVYYAGAGHHDAIWAGVPINEDAEVYFGVFRGAEQPRYTESERDLVALVLRGLRWFHRQQMLGHGLHISASPLTPVERAVLQGLLRGLPEKQIAAQQGQSPHTTHEYVTRIFRKYNVNQRAALMALWLGRQAPPD